MKKYRLLLVVLLILCLVMSACAAQEPESEKEATAYPTKPIEIVVPWNAGGGTDMTARVLAEALTKEFGVQVNVTNMVGGNAITGSKYVYESDPDGYTILADNSSSSSYMAVMDDLPYAIENRAFLGVAASCPFVYMASIDSGFTSLDDVKAAIEKDAANFVYGGLTGTSGTDLCMALYMSSIGQDPAALNRVPYTGTGQMLPAIAGGHVMFGATGISSVMSYAQAGTVTVLATTGTERYAELPEVPTTIEAGYPELNVQTWTGFSAPPGTPQYVIDAWRKAIANILQDKELVADLSTQGNIPYQLTAEEHKQLVLEEMESARTYFQ